MVDPSQLQEIDLRRDPNTGEFVAVDPSDGTVFALPVQDLDVSGTVSTDQIDDDGSGDVEFLSPVRAAELSNGDWKTIRAGNKPGSSPDARLDAALDDATDNDKIILEDTSYSATRTISKRVELIGTSLANFRGTEITFGTTWTFSDRSTLRGVKISGDVVFNGLSLTAIFCTGSGTVTVASDKGKIIQCDAFNVVFQSGTSKGLVDSCTNVIVTDNGSNTVGDIS